MSTLSVVVHGLLRQDGTLELDHLPQIPPGPVRITLETMPGKPTQRVHLPDPPWEDDSISAPFDLPYPGPIEPIETRQAVERLPDIWEWTEEDFRP